MNRTVKPVAVAVLTVALALIGLPASSQGPSMAIGTGCCKQ